MSSAPQNSTLFGLIGAGGFAREVMPFCKKTLAAEIDIAFVETSPTSSSLNGYRLISEDAFAVASYHSKLFNVAIADSGARKKLALKHIELGHIPASLIAPGVTIYDDVELADGGIICANVILTSNVRIGRFFHANINSYVAHDCVIGDFVTFAPNVACNGNVHIGDHAYIGTGAIIKQGSKDAPRRIGKGAVIGMGAVVTKDVPPFTTVVGNPARVLEQRPK